MTDARPVIGICAALERAQWTSWDQRAVLVPHSYIKAFQRAGALVLTVPPDPRLVENPDELLNRIDGLVLAGGADVDPGSYGEESHPETNGTVPERDEVEIALTRRAVERDVPVLGICRGMQVMNVAFGGTLRQHLPDELGHTEHRRRRGTFDDSEHDVRLQKGSLAARAAGEEIHSTKSHHHQGVAMIGEGLEVTGWSALDELPEAIECRGSRFVLGVQWHPEADEDSRLIDSFVAEVRDHRTTRVS